MFTIHCVPACVCVRVCAVAGLTEDDPVAATWVVEVVMKCSSRQATGGDNIIMEVGGSFAPPQGGKERERRRGGGGGVI